MEIAKVPVGAKNLSPKTETSSLVPEEKEKTRMDQRANKMGRHLSAWSIGGAFLCLYPAFANAAKQATMTPRELLFAFGLLAGGVCVLCLSFACIISGNLLKRGPRPWHRVYAVMALIFTGLVTACFLAAIGRVAWADPQQKLWDTAALVGFPVFVVGILSSFLSIRLFRRGVEHTLAKQ